MKKRTYFTLKEMVSFGNYLLSEKRKEIFKAVSEDNLDERLSGVHDSDIQNWKYYNYELQEKAV